MKTKVLSAAAVFAIVVGAAGAAFAGDGLTTGDYSIPIPGIGHVVLAVSDTGVEVTAVPEGYTVELNSDDDDSEFLILDAAGDVALKLEFEGDELEIKAMTALPGTHEFNLPGIGKVMVTIEDDGSIGDVIVPEGFIVEFGDRNEVKIMSEDGTIEMKLEVEDGVIQLQVEVDDESDAVIDDESDDDHSDDVLSDDSDDDHDSDDDDDDDRDKGHDSDDDDDSHDESHDD